MSRLTRDGTAEPVSRDQILLGADHKDWQPYPVDIYSAICNGHTYNYTYNGDREILNFLVQLTTSRIGNLPRSIHTLRCMFGHTYSKNMDQPGMVANPARGQLNKEI